MTTKKQSNTHEPVIREFPDGSWIAHVPPGTRPAKGVESARAMERLRALVAKTMAEAGESSTTT